MSASDYHTSHDFTKGSVEWLKVVEKIQNSYIIINQRIQNLSDINRYEGFDRNVVQKIKQMDDELLKEIKTYVLPKMFTTRIDYCSTISNDKIETIYIGAIAVPEADISSWAAPLAADLMYKRISTNYNQKSLYIP